MIKHNEFWLRLVLNDKITFDTLLELMKTFHHHFLLMQKDFKPITKASSGRKFNNGATLKYADWDLIQEQTKDIVEKHGFTIKQHKTGANEQRYIQTIIQHDCGYFEEYHFPMVSLPDSADENIDCGNVTYYKRYAYVTLLKLSTQDEDSDTTDYEKTTTIHKKKATHTNLDELCPECSKNLRRTEINGSTFIGCTGWKKDGSGCKFYRKNQ